MGTQMSNSDAPDIYWNFCWQPPCNMLWEYSRKRFNRHSEQVGVSITFLKNYKYLRMDTSCSTCRRCWQKCQRGETIRFKSFCQLGPTSLLMRCKQKKRSKIDRTCPASCLHHPAATAEGSGSCCVTVNTYYPEQHWTTLCRNAVHNALQFNIVCSLNI